MDSQDMEMVTFLAPCFGDIHLKESLSRLLPGDPLVTSLCRAFPNREPVRVTMPRFKYNKLDDELRQVFLKLSEKQKYFDTQAFLDNPEGHLKLYGELIWLLNQLVTEGMVMSGSAEDMTEEKD